MLLNLPLNLICSLHARRETEIQKKDGGRKARRYKTDRCRKGENE
jgi:hypothetical protein